MSLTKKPRCYGLAVGGPLDGQYLGLDNNMHRIPKDGETVYRDDGTEAAYQPHKTFTYLFIERYWVPYSVRQGAPSIAHVLNILETEYAERREARDAET